MSKRMWLFMAGAVLYPVFVVLFDGSRPGHVIAWSQALQYASYGAFVAGLLVGGHKLALMNSMSRYRKSLGLSNTKLLNSSDISTKVVLPVNSADAFELCLDSVRNIPGGKVVVAQAEKGFLRARNNGGFRSAYGQYIDFQLTPIGERFTEVSVRCRAINGKDLFDYCCTVDEMRLVCEYLKGRSEAQTFEYPNGTIQPHLS